MLSFDELFFLKPLRLFFRMFAERLLVSSKFYRILESLPGVVTWSFIMIPLALAPFYPEYVAFFALIYSIYWTYNAVKFVLFAYLGHIELEKNLTVDWLKKVQEDFPEEWNKYYYCAIVPFATESINVIRPTLQSILETNFPNERKIICLSSEKAIPQGLKISQALKEEFGQKFGFFLITEHELKPGEIKGKASNQNHAARFLSEQIKKLGILSDFVLVTSNDADVQNHKQYPAYLLHRFLSQGGEEKHQRIYQPIPTDYSSFWEAKFFSRIIVTLGVQWRLALQYRGDYRCTVYSFYSLSLKFLESMGFWSVDVIPEDERTMINAIFNSGPNFKVVPLFITTSGRPVQANSIWEAFVEQYKQVRRWAWGASEFAYFLSNALKDKNIPWKFKLPFIFNQMRTAVEWSLTSIVPMFGGIIPGVMNQEYNYTIYAYTIPVLMSYLFTFCSFLILIIIIIEWRLAPDRRSKGWLFTLFSIAQWVLIPYVGLVLSSLPALEAQTRLMFNQRLTYVASKKE